ncbi:ceramidase domain-containing protein [Pseudaminobacter sp. 19-2017]|uniref:Ceramidase domain-containing protein n=1 Tax=Pseudaminobacter soli (ex Zhang et al. 2022) TaxID=2831468 RepID=A0A942I731_9HYPH|nr:ceramidase domain-containing protein [Pseudaminobacter soli]MBS3647960.1 ceramidase domain-containing protein [Pseudaminobacter soli]
MDASLLENVDLYCERLGPGFWAEPVNALSNLSFVLAGLWGVAAMRRTGADTFATTLAWWVVAIGVGSFLFHTFATEIMKWADILPIATFTLAYSIFTLRRFARLSWTATLAIFIGFYAIAGTVTLLVPDWLRQATNGSTGYLPPFLALIVLGLIAALRGSPAGWYNIAAAGIFVLAVTFRMLDPMVCGTLPIGTHFMWHLLNGLMLGIVLAAIAKHGEVDRGMEKPRTHLAPAAR